MLTKEINDDIWSLTNNNLISGITEGNSDINFRELIFKNMKDGEINVDKVVDIYKNNNLTKNVYYKEVTEQLKKINNNISLLSKNIDQIDISPDDDLRFIKEYKILKSKKGEEEVPFEEEKNEAKEEFIELLKGKFTGYNDINQKLSINDTKQNIEKRQKLYDEIIKLKDEINDFSIDNKTFKRYGVNIDLIVKNSLKSGAFNHIKTVLNKESFKDLLDQAIKDKNLDSDKYEKFYKKNIGSQVDDLISKYVELNTKYFELNRQIDET